MKKFINKIKSIFEDKKKRYLYLFLFILPFIIAIVVFGVVAFNEAKNALSLITGQETKDEYQIKSQNYLLRDNATDYQEELFFELKGMIDGDVEHTNEQLAESICKNYVADFYTWSNKIGQYDVGGMYYVYTPQKKEIYIKARDEFYKYINEYINMYGKENLLQVNEVLSSIGKYEEESYITKAITGEEIEYNEVYLIKCSWSYVENAIFDTGKYIKKMNFVVINNEGRFEIVEAYE